MSLVNNQKLDPPPLSLVYLTSRHGTMTTGGQLYHKLAASGAICRVRNAIESFPEIQVDGIHLAVLIDGIGNIPKKEKELLDS